MARAGHFTRKARNRRLRGRMSSHQMDNQLDEETERIERLKREQSNDGLFKGDREALDRMRKLDEKSGYRNRNHERDRED